MSRRLNFDGFQDFDEAGGVVVEVIDAVGAVER
jgi:hypothetical protein